MLGILLSLLGLAAAAGGGRSSRADPNPVNTNNAPVLVAADDGPAPVVVEYEPEPVVVENDPDPVVEENDPEPVAEENDPEPFIVEYDPEPVVVENDPEPVAEENDPDPVAEENDPDPVAEENDPDPVAEENDPDPVAEENDPDPVTAEGGADTTDNVLAATKIPEDNTLEISAGRVTTLEIEDDRPIAQVEILSEPAHGTATVNPDNTIALVLSGSDYNSGPLGLEYQITYADGGVETDSLNLNVGPLEQDLGWGLGQHYMLEEDENGDIIVETGENHRKVYVSESEEALTRADIAALENLQPEDITKNWLRDHPEYGGDEEMAVATDVGMEIWYDLLGGTNEPSSHWLLFEAGYEYTDIGRVIDRGAMGESELNPLHITSWGEGDRPVLNTGISIGQEDTKFVVMTDLEVTGGFTSLTGETILLSDMGFSETLVNIRDSEDFTLHDSEISYTVGVDPKGDTWTAVTQGILVKNTDGVLLEGNIFHHNAWQDDYHEDGSAEGGMAPNQFSHNVYLQYDTSDVTFRDNITSQSSSYGAHLRGGAFAEDNVFLDNNVAVSMFGGDYAGNGHVGNFTLFTDNLITSAGYKEAPSGGAVGWGMQNKGIDTVWLDNIITHFADPDNPEEFADKPLTQFAWDNKDDGSTTYDDTIVFNWKGSIEGRQDKPGAIDQNIENVDQDTANNTTIQNFAADLLGRDDVTIDEMMDYLLSLTNTDLDDTITADDIIAYFQEGFNVAPSGDGSATDHRFIPSNLGDGVRWDNRLNWAAEELPDAGDSVDLGGNHVQYGATTAITNLDFGSSGALTVNSGKLSVSGELETGAEAATLTTDGAGQFWTNGYDSDGAINIHVDGGRFANTGDFTGDATISIEDNGQAILAADGASMVLGDNSTLQIEGSDAKVGFDGDDASETAILQMTDDAALNMIADIHGISTIREFRSGAWDQDTPEVQSGLSMDGTLRIDLSAYENTSGTLNLIEVDALDGVFDNIEVYGLGSDRNAEIVTDYTSDTLSIALSEGAGALTYNTVGEAGDGSDEGGALWDALTANQGVYDDDLPELTVEDGPIDQLAIL